MFCVHCGEGIYDCLCVEWCYEHDCLNEPPHRCNQCIVAFERAQEERRKLAPSKPWYVRLWWRIRWEI